MTDHTSHVQDFSISGIPPWSIPPALGSAAFATGIPIYVWSPHSTFSGEFLYFLKLFQGYLRESSPFLHNTTVAKCECVPIYSSVISDLRGDISDNCFFKSSNKPWKMNEHTSNISKILQHNSKCHRPERVVGMSPGISHRDEQERQPEILPARNRSTFNFNRISVKSIFIPILNPKKYTQQVKPPCKTDLNRITDPVIGVNHLAELISDRVSCISGTIICILQNEHRLQPQPARLGFNNYSRSSLHGDCYARLFLRRGFKSTGWETAESIWSSVSPYFAMVTFQFNVAYLITEQDGDFNWDQ